MAKAKRAPKRRVITKAEFIGAKMSNFLFNIANNTAYLTDDTRELARKLYEQWDSFSSVRIQNPIESAQFEKAFAAGDMK